MGKKPQSKWRKLAIEIVRWAVPVLTTLLLSVVFLPTLFAIFSDEGPIRNIINEEAGWAMDKETTRVLSLFTDDAYVRDAAGGNFSLQQIWHGKIDIGKRYGSLPEFSYLKHDAIEITVSSDKTYARATADTIGAFIVNGVETKITSNQGEKWTFEKIGEDWKITSFTYNLP